MGGIIVKEVVSPVGRVGFWYVHSGVGTECEFIPVLYCIYSNFAFFEREVST